MNEAKAALCNVVNYLTSSVNISHLPLCNYDAPILCLKFRVTSLTISGFAVVKGSEVGLLVRSDEYENVFSLIGRNAGYTEL